MIAASAKKRSRRTVSSYTERPTGVRSYSRIAATRAPTKPPAVTAAAVTRRAACGTSTATIRQAPAATSRISDGEIENQSTGGRVTAAIIPAPGR
jgi:hypothetical protein